MILRSALGKRRLLLMALMIVIAVVAVASNWLRQNEDDSRLALERAVFYFQDLQPGLDLSGYRPRIESFEHKRVDGQPLYDIVVVFTDARAGESYRVKVHRDAFGETAGISSAGP